MDKGDQKPRSFASTGAHPMFDVGDVGRRSGDVSTANCDQVLRSSMEHHTDLVYSSALTTNTTYDNIPSAAAAYAADVQVSSLRG